MPLWKFRSPEQAERHSNLRFTTGEASVGTALFLLTLSEASRRGIRTAQRGLIGYPSLGEAELAREGFALEQLRLAGREEESEAEPHSI